MTDDPVTTNGGTGTIVRPGEGLSVRWGPAGVIRILAGAESTDDSFSVVEATEPPGTAAPLHVHHGEAEAFYVLEGELELTCGEHTLNAQAGDFVYTPKNIPHKYAVIGDHPARVLLLFSRSGFESFFAEAGSPLDLPPSSPPDPETFRLIVEKYEMGTARGARTLTRGAYRRRATLGAGPFENYRYDSEAGLREASDALFVPMRPSQPKGLKATVTLLLRQGGIRAWQ